MSTNYDALPWIILESCKGCGDCIDACRRGLLQKIESHQHGISVPWLDQVDQCTACGQCEAVCPWSAIVMTQNIGLARKRFVKSRPLPAVTAQN
jgi:NAD-dependent dihydropyrimidine dehydrogenase PreA subunit